MRSVTEENMPCFYGCTGCSPFAPDHVCVLTVERVPQCGRPYGMIKTGAHYGYDDGWIHHSKLHRDLNSFFTIDKGECIDPLAGEWAGVNAHAAKETAGRTSRIQLHSLSDAPTTGCGCFHFIMFRTDQPRPGVAIMHAGWEGKAPDGRRWSDLHYELGGKQAPGVSGCSAGYFSSKKFLQAEGGWKSVVWVTGKVAAIAAKRLAADATVSE
jgi:acetyl-CoA decarbonylase/synthase complex subunit beta